jgi:DNA-binding CsgD family transcriptional regulator
MNSSKNEGLHRRMEELTELQLPLLIVDSQTGLLLKANSEAQRLFSFQLEDGQSRPLAESLEFHRDITAVIAGLSQSDRPYSTCTVEHNGISYEVIACRLDHGGDVYYILACPGLAPEAKGVFGNLDTAPTAVESSQATIEALNKQLHFERLVRQIMTRIYSSLDKDTILQGVVDGLGRALKCQRCLVIIENSLALPVVTHEYAEADISPLGLGRTAKFPVSVFERLREGVVAVPDVTNLRTVKGVMLEDVNDLLDNSVSSMAGVPMVHRGVVHGVIVALQLGHIRKWEVQDLDFLQICAHHAAISLENSQSQQRVKDQLFNVNVWSTLTQQLTNTLEAANRSPSRVQEKSSRTGTDTGELPSLSSRELEVLKLIASGLANKEIANQLFLTESTVELHASRIRKKLKLRSRTALVKYACDQGIV